VRRICTSLYSKVTRDVSDLWNISKPRMPFRTPYFCSESNICLHALAPQPIARQREALHVPRSNEDTKFTPEQQQAIGQYASLHGSYSLVPRLFPPHDDDEQ